MSGIFGLSAYNDQNLAGLIPDKTRESFREYGYFGGGVPGPGGTVGSIVDRVDYSNDTSTASVRGPLSSARGYYPGSTGNSNFGYFAGGWSPALLSSVDRIDYSNDIETPSIRGPLSLARYYISSVGNSNFGYFASGLVPSGLVSTVDRINYSNDLNADINRGYFNIILSGTTGNSNFGYFGGGNPGPLSTVNRIDYSNDLATASVRGPLSLARSHLAATGNSNFGYFGGGGSPAISTIDRIDYSNDTQTASVRGPLSLARTNLSATGNSNFGYFSGGSDLVPSSRTNYSQTQRIDYSNDTVNTIARGNLSVSRSFMKATSSHNFGGTPISQYGVFPKPFGYFGGGAPFSTVDRIDYSNDTSQVSVRSALSASISYYSATGNSNFGYFGGGNPGSRSTVDRIDYSNDNSSFLTRGPLSLGRNGLSATGNSNFGYFGGGLVPGPTRYSTIDRINYSNDNTTASIRGPLTLSLSYPSSTGNYNFGYFAGGGTSPTFAGDLSIIQRVDYSNDNAIATVRSNLQLIKQSTTAIGNNNFAYFGGGSNYPDWYSTVERLDYSNDTTNSSIRTSLSLARNFIGATGNSNFGYFGGGYYFPAPGGIRYSTVDRVDYSNDTTTASVRGPLSSTRSSLAATSPLTPSSAFSQDQLIRGTSDTDFQPTSTFFDIQSMRRIEDTTNESVKKRVLGSYGYFAGGTSYPTNYSTINRIDYANDTNLTLVRGPLSIVKDGTAGTSNSNYGYVGPAGGLSPNSITTDRVDYSNDNATTLVRANSPVHIRYGAVGNSNFAYYCGNYAILQSYINRLDYSADTVSTVRRGQLSAAKGYTAGTGNSNFGYIGGSPGSLLYTSIDRISYANDNVTVSNRGKFPIANKRFAAATGNSNFGYFGGGSGGPTPFSSIIDRVDFANDTVNALRRASLSFSDDGSAANGNSNFGYWGGGGFGGYTGVSRLDYSNDLQNGIFRGSLTSARGNGLAGFSNARNS